MASFFFWLNFFSYYRFLYLHFRFCLFFCTSIPSLQDIHQISIFYFPWSYRLAVFPCRDILISGHFRLRGTHVRVYISFHDTHVQVPTSSRPNIHPHPNIHSTVVQKHVSIPSSDSARRPLSSRRLRPRLLLFGGHICGKRLQRKPVIQSMRRIMWQWLPLCGSQKRRLLFLSSVAPHRSDLLL